MRRDLAMLFWLSLAAAGCAAPHRSPAEFNAMEELPPQGATAKCRDGRYTFALESRAACSHHGGVDKWLREI